MPGEPGLSRCGLGFTVLAREGGRGAVWVSLLPCGPGSLDLGISPRGRQEAVGLWGHLGSERGWAVSAGVRVQQAAGRVQVNTKGAFWFQSGKLVTKMFQKIQDLIDDKDALVFVLIEEVGAPGHHATFL